MASISVPPPAMVDIDSVGWADPPAKEKGDADETPLFTEVGRALSAWEMLESCFAMAFTQFSSGSQGESIVGASGRIFGSVPAGMTRQKMLEEIADMYAVYEDRNFDLAGFKKLLNHYGSAVRSRNNIAHGVVCACRMGDAPDSPVEFFLGPAMYLTARNVRVDKWRSKEKQGSKVVPDAWTYSYTAADIAEFAARYRALNSQVMKVTSTLIELHVAESMKQAGLYVPIQPAPIEAV